MNNSKKIDMSNIDDVKQSLDKKSLKVCVVGIGRIGLPTALSFAKAGLQTIGVDINEKLVDSVNNGNFPLKDEPGHEELLNEVRKDGRFSATTKIDDAVPQSDLILLSLPTPMDENNIPDYSALRIVGKQLSKILGSDSLVIIESTIEPGFIEDEFVEIINETGKLKAGENFTIGVCPENANPGEILHDFNNLPRLVGGINKSTTKIITEIYRKVFSVELIEMPNCKTANAVKLTTNVFRDLNIAYVNELALMFDKLGIDTLEVLEAAKKKYNFQIHLPGPGVGGPCLPINSYQFLNMAKRLGIKLDLVKSGREINERMSDHVIDLVTDAFQEVNKPVDKSKILILGVSYKANVKDIQLTPAEDIIKKLQNLGAKILIYDPFYIGNDVFGIQVEGKITDVISEVDATIIITAHKEFSLIDPSIFSKMKYPILVDTRGIIDVTSAKKAGLVFRGIGRGKI